MITPQLSLLLTKYKHMKFEKGVKMNLDDIKMPKLFRTIKRKMSYKSHNCKECNWKRSAGENEPLLVDHIWCETCSPIQLQREFILWKSGNNEIDDFIRFQQIKVKTPSNLIEWIPYDRFTDIKYLEQGGFSIVYSATWMDGPIQGWNLEQKQWNRLSKTKVALKVLKDSQNISSEFLEELHLNLQRGSTYVVKCLGFTQEPKSKDYAMVLEFAENGNLRHYLNCNSNSIDWYQKIEILKQIGHHLYKLHEKKIIHKNFHIGNILYANHIDDLIIISDLGICQPVSKTACLPQKEIYGVLPSVAPEVLREKSYSKASDIYAFGGIIYEIITGHPPFHDRSHDFQLALDICNGVHPTIPEETPKSVVNLLKRCWEPDPKKRITAIEIFSMIRCCFIYEDECKISHRISKEIEQCKCIHQTHPTEQTKIHPEANYHSRLLSFPKLEETLASGI